METLPSIALLATATDERDAHSAVIERRINSIILTSKLPFWTTPPFFAIESHFLSSRFSLYVLLYFFAASYVVSFVYLSLSLRRCYLGSNGRLSLAIDNRQRYETNGTV